MCFELGYIYIVSELYTAEVQLIKEENKTNLFMLAAMNKQTFRYLQAHAAKDISPFHR